ncbi:unnamed protein product, partial [Adineta ricciae]
ITVQMVEITFSGVDSSFDPRYRIDRLSMKSSMEF